MLKKAYVEITNHCNLACSFCPKTKREPRTMSAQEFGLVLSRLEGYVQYVYLHVMGEPPRAYDAPRPRQSAGYEDLHHDERHAAPKAFR